MGTPISFLIAGAGSRGTTYANYIAAHPQDARVVAVAEPRQIYRERMAAKHGIAPERVFCDWREAAARDRLADAVVIATQDSMHAEPSIAFARQGYHILLEKPMAPNEADCRRIAEAALASGRVFAVCHVMRYTAYTRRLKEFVAGGLIGDPISMQHLEPVGYWHQAHSFVRGNWRNEAQSSSMLLAKSCHDLDWIRHIMGAKCEWISSFGSLRHFRRECQPAGAADRCLECSIEPSCPYSAREIYLGGLKRGNKGFPVNTIVADVTEENVLEALRVGPYGRCVYACDNDVVDNQVVNMEFEGGRTASFTMTAFNQAAHRQTRLFGSRGELIGDGETIRHFDFLTRKTETIDTRPGADAPHGGHGGGDQGVVQSFIAAAAANDPSQVLSGPEETLETHRMVFAAERARRERRVVRMEA